MGKPTSQEVSASEYIGCRSEPGELKHLSTRRKREYSLSSGERKGKTPSDADRARAVLAKAGATCHVLGHAIADPMRAIEFPARGLTGRAQRFRRQ